MNKVNAAHARPGRLSRMATNGFGARLHRFRFDSHEANEMRRRSRTGVNVSTGVSVLLGLLTLAGCSTDLVVRDTDGATASTSSSPNLTTGFAYKLPLIAFDVTSSWTLIACDETFDRVTLENGTLAPDPKNLPKIKFKVTTTVAPTYVADDARLFIVDYPATNATFAKTDIKVEQYGNGTLKSINAHITGEGPAIAASLIDTASQIAGTFLHAAIAGQAMLPSAKPAALCTADTLKKISARMAHQKEYDGLRVHALTATGQKLTDFNTQLDAYSAQLKEDNVTLTYSKTERWVPDDFGAFHQGVAGEKAAWTVRRAQFLSLHKVIDQLSIDPSQMGWFDLGAVAAVKPYTQLRLVLDGGYAGPENSIATDGKARYSDTPSLVYRLPVQSKLTICMNDCGGASPGPELFSSWYSVPQNGPMFAVPLHNGPFDDNTITAEFAESGVPTSLGYVSESSLKAGAAAVDAAAKAAATTAGQAQTKDLRDLQQKTTVLKAKKEYLDAQKALQDAQQGSQ